MKKSALIAALCIAFGVSAIASAQGQTAQQPAKRPPAVAKRQINQQRRIAQGVKNGQLTKGETKRLEHQQARIHRTKRVDRAMNGGKLTPQNKAQLNRMQNRASKNIYRAKHNDKVQH